MNQRLLNADAIIFDVGNVLLPFDPQKVSSLLPEKDREALSGAMFGPDWRWSAFDLGAESNEDIAQSMADAAGLPDGKDKILYALFHFHESMVPLPLYLLIPELKRMGKKLYALTNYAEPPFSYARQRYPHLQLLDGEVVSSREKLCKPDPAIFHLIRDRYGLIPERTLFIDDSKPNVDAAAALGFLTWHYMGEDPLA